MSSTTAWPRVSSRSVITILAPSRASVAAQAAPIPDAPPVTIATLPSTCPIAPSSQQQNDDNSRHSPTGQCREECAEGSGGRAQAGAAPQGAVGPTRVHG